MNSEGFIQAIEDAKVLVNRNGELITKKIYKQNFSKNYIYSDFSVGFFMVFDEVRKNEKGNIELYLCGHICGAMSPESWVIA